MKRSSTTGKYELNQEIIDKMADSLNDMLENFLDNNDEPVIGEFFISLLDFAADLRDSLDSLNIEMKDNGDLGAKSIIEDRSFGFGPTDEEKEFNSKLN